MAIHVIVSLLSVVVGAILGFCASYLTWKRDISYRRRLVARAFYEEISRLEDVIGFYSKAFKTGEGLPPEWNTRAPIRIGEPFYENGFFFALIKEIFSLRGEGPSATCRILQLHFESREISHRQRDGSFIRWALRPDEKRYIECLRAPSDRQEPA